MKKIYLILTVLFLTVQAYSQYTTPGLGKTYTFKALADTLNSGVVVESENVYVVNADLTISANDTLELDNRATIKIGNLKTIILEGHAAFTPNDTAYITRMDSTELTPVNPKGIYLKGENSTGTFKNILFEYNGLRASGTSVDVDNCTFTLSNTKLASNAIDLLSGKNTVTNSRFIKNGGPAIGSGATSALSLSFKNNYLLENNTNESNRPQINMGAPGDNLIEIIDNTIIGKGKITKVGGIAVGNLLAAGGENNFVIQGNTVKGNRYGITTNGKMNVKIIDNRILDNKYETNPMAGGSGIALYNRNNTQNVIITGNYIEEHLWGITHINSDTSDLGGKINLGRLDVAETDVNYNPGKNIFKNNGNSNALYDLYNNTPFTVYAQGNTWNAAVQDSVSIESVVTHKADNPALGLVIFMYNPAPTGVEKVAAFPFKYTVRDDKIILNDLIAAKMELYSLSGTSLARTSNSSTVDVESLPAGVYVLKVLSDNKMYVTKILL